MTVSVEEQAPQAEALPPEAPAKPTLKAVDEYASFDTLLNKKARERDVTVKVNEGEFKVHLRAIGHVEYDRLQSQCPPTPEQAKKGLIYDDNTFGPRLIAAVVTRPKMDLDQVNRLWNDPNWAGGEIGGLYRACVEICQVGLDIPFTVSG